VNIVREDEVIEGITLQGKQDLIALASMAYRRGILSDRDNGTNILDTTCLSVEGGDDDYLVVVP
jgi:hypothetical protein